MLFALVGMAAAQGNNLSQLQSKLVTREKCSGFLKIEAGEGGGSEWCVRCTMRRYV